MCLDVYRPLLIEPCVTSREQLNSKHTRVMQRSSSGRFCHSSHSAEHRLEKLLVEHVEMAYPHYAFTYHQTAGHGGNQRPDVLIKENSRGRKTVIWHETDEWEHSDRSAEAEVLREMECCFRSIQETVRSTSSAAVPMMVAKSLVLRFGTSSTQSAPSSPHFG